MLNQATIEILTSIKNELETNGGKLSPQFVQDYADKCTFTYSKADESTRVCVMTTTNGNKFVDNALVLDPANDIAEIGNSVAREKCIDQLWGFLGGLAKALA